MIRCVARCSELVKIGAVSLGSVHRGRTMTLAEWCVFGALLLYLLTIVSIKWIRFRGFDNSAPRYPGLLRGRHRAARARRSPERDRDLSVLRLCGAARRT